MHALILAAALTAHVHQVMPWLLRFVSALPPIVVLAVTLFMAHCADASMLDQVKQQLAIMHSDAIPRDQGAGYNDASPFTAGRGEESGQCYINVREENYDTWELIAQSAPRVPYDVKLRTVIAHELGHCQRGADEMAADRYALSWTYENRPQDFEQVVNFLAKMRSHFGCRQGYACPNDIKRFAREIAQ